MKKIYLASKSKARKKLLEKLGLKFKVFPSKAKERKSKGNLTYARLVMNNARDKAKDVAAKVKDGIIVAADTITAQDGRIFGKPKDLKDARRMLKKISPRPQTVYTGIAVIDKDSNKIFLDYEKTKVHMHPLNDREIDNYFKTASPLDKAGSFDIQGKGAQLIKKIDGCFYNVVGLPLSKLQLIFKKIGLAGLLKNTPKLSSSSPGLTGGSTGGSRIFYRQAFRVLDSRFRGNDGPIKHFLFSVLCLLFFSGCASEYNLVTRQEEVYYYNTDKEVRMGQAIDRQVANEFKTDPDPLMQKRVEDIGKRIAEVSDRKEIDYHFKVLDEDDVNAVSLPGGYVYIFKGLVEKVDNDDELAAVIAHEIGHIVARHSIKKLQATQGYSILRVLVAVSPVPGEVGNAADIAFNEFLLGYSREDELLADQLGARYAKLAGYNPGGMITFLYKLQSINRRTPPRQQSYYRTHPYVSDRVRVIKQELGEKINFGDYINIQDKPHE